MAIVLLCGYLFLKDRTREAYIFSVSLCVLLPLFASFLYWPFYVPRYAFHLYPLLIVVFAFTLCTLSAAIRRRVVTTLGQTLGQQGSAGTVLEAFALVLLAVFLSQDVYHRKPWRSYPNIHDRKDPMWLPELETFIGITRHLDCLCAYD
jgi:hypothetical protein